MRVLAHQQRELGAYFPNDFYANRPCRERPRRVGTAASARAPNATATLNHPVAFASMALTSKERTEQVHGPARLDAALSENRMRSGRKVLARSMNARTVGAVM